LICGRQRLRKKIYKIELFKSTTSILKKYKPESINPNIRTAQEARAMWDSFPGYKEKIKKCGLIAMTLE